MQLLAKFKKTLYTGFRATLNFRKFCIICSYDVTGADFENSLHAFGQSEKS